jgi:predicted membrane-bound mannosyltransferase
MVTACLFVSGFGTNAHGPIDYIRAYGPWFHRAQGASIHNHAFRYYLKLLIWSRIKLGKTAGEVYSEALIVFLAVAGALAVLRPRVKREALGGSVLLWRFVALYTILLTLIYSVIPYKTPWCLLSFLLGMCLLAGLAVSKLLAVLPGAWMKVLAGVPLLIAAAQLTNQAYRASYIAFADPHNPYVYAATASDIIKLEGRIDDLAKFWPEHQNMIIKVFSNGNYYWPIPWYLRHYPNVGYFAHPPASKEEAAAPVTVCAIELDDKLEPLLSDDDLMNGYNEVRNGVFYETFIRMDVWTTYLNGKNGGVIKRIAPPPPAE